MIDYNPQSGAWYMKNRYNLEGSFYENAFIDYASMIWGGTKFADEIQDITFHRALSSMQRDNQYGEEQRRKLLYWYLEPLFSRKSAENTLNKLYPILPSSNLYFKRAVTNLCTAYDEPPQIETGNEKLDEILVESNFSYILQKIYNILKIHNEIIIRPYILLENGKKKLKYQYYTPDKYRVEYDRLNNPKEIWISYSTFDKDRSKINRFYVWDAEKLRVADENGDFVEFIINENGTNKVVSSYPNRYGRIPFQIRKLSNIIDNELEIDGGGLFELLRGQLLCNALDLYSLQSLTYNSFPMRFMINWNLEDITEISPAGVFAKDNVKADDQLLPPEIQEMTADTSYQNINEMKEQIIQDILRQMGLPAGAVGDIGNVPSAAALKELRRELEEIRQQDISILREQDKELIELIRIVLNNDIASEYRGKFGKPLDVNITYNDITTYVDEKEMIEQAEYYKANGLISPREYIEKLTYKKFNSDEEAIAEMKNNIEMFQNIGVQNEPKNTSGFRGVGNGTEQSEGVLEADQDLATNITGIDGNQADDSGE